MGLIIKNYDIDDLIEEIAATSQENFKLMDELVKATYVIESFNPDMIEWSVFGSDIYDLAVELKIDFDKLNSYEM